MAADLCSSIRIRVVLMAVRSDNLRTVHLPTGLLPLIPEAIAFIILILFLVITGIVITPIARHQSKHKQAKSSSETK